MRHFILTALFVSLLGLRPSIAEPLSIENPGWTQWRGNNREATHVPLPKTFSDTPEIVWQKTMTGNGIAGIVGNNNIVIVADRNQWDSADIFRCLDRKTGEERWKLEYAATSKFDFGNSPRATPLIAGNMTFLLGASGHLHAVDWSSGKIVWNVVLPRAFGGTMPHWGFATSPLLVDATVADGKLTGGKLIIPPGAANAGIVALDAVTGKAVWQSANGRTAGYASPLLATLGGKRQIIFYDEKSLGGWDVASGNRLWELLPKRGGDFNVSTPIPLDGNRLFVVTENNGARIYRVDKDGMIEPQPIAEQAKVVSDSNSAVASAGRIFVVSSGLHCLDGTDLKILWTLHDKSLSSYATLILGEDRLLVGTYEGEVLLVDITSLPGKIVSRFSVFEEDDVMLSHPAVIGGYLILRSEAKAVCVRL